MSDPTKSDLAARAAAGAKFLDEKEPGWWSRIDLSNLDMSAPYRYADNKPGCILCQLCPPNEDGDQRYREMVGILGISNQVNELGFYATQDEYIDDRYIYEKLDVLWAREIQERRNPA